MRHPEADLRAWGARRRWGVDSYTRERILRSYESLAERLAAGNIDPDGLDACDIGCGAGYDTFALAGSCDRVVAVDVSRRAVLKARAIARRTHVRHATFQVADAVSFVPRSEVDLVWCNLMSHGTRSRLALFDRFSDSLRDGGWLVYSEVCQGYALMEAHRAIETRDAAELRGRVCQTLNGFQDRGGFRWFASGSGADELGRAGFDVYHRSTGSWLGVPTVETLFARRTRRRAGQQEPRNDPDYTTLPALVASGRKRYASVPGSPPGPTPDKHAPHGGDPVLDACDVVVQMGRVIDPTLSLAPSGAERTRHRLGLSDRLRWDELDRLNGLLVRALSGRSATV